LTGPAGSKTCGAPLYLFCLYYESTGLVLYQITNKSQEKNLATEDTENSEVPSGTKDLSHRLHRWTRI